MKKTLKYLGTIAVLIVAVGVSSCSDKEAAPSKTEVSNSTDKFSWTEKELKKLDAIIKDDVDKALTGGEPVIFDKQVINANKMFQDYIKDGAAADQLYKGKKIIVTGIVESVESGVGGIPYVVLKVDHLISNPQARFVREHRGVAAKLKENQKVAFYCVGDSTFGIPMLEKCLPVLLL